MPHLSLVRADGVSAPRHPSAAASGVPHGAEPHGAAPGIDVEPASAGWSRITVHHPTRGVVAHGAMRADLATDTFLLGLARYLLGEELPAVRRTG